MAAFLEEIQGLESKQPLFREFCEINGLTNGGFFNAVDYIIWSSSLTLVQQLEIIRKYRPDFKMKNCNL